jgi:hypothetical protein
MSKYRHSTEFGWQRLENGEWVFCYPPPPGVITEDSEAERDAELEIFGDTMDEPIPEDLADMLISL